MINTIRILETDSSSASDPHENGQSIFSIEFSLIFFNDKLYFHIKCQEIRDRNPGYGIWPFSRNLNAEFKPVFRILITSLR